MRDRGEYKRHDRGAEGDGEMTERDSFFSRLKQQADPAPRGLGAFPSPLSAPPPSKQPEKLSAKIAESLVKLDSLEKKDLGTGHAAADGFNAELQAAQRRIAGLENVVSGFQKMMDETRAEKTSAQEAVARALEQFRTEMTALRSGAGAAAAEGPDLQTERRRISELESSAAELRKAVEEMRGEKTAAQETAARTLEQFREEMSALRSMADSSEEQKTLAAHNRITELESAVAGFEKIIEEMRGDKTSAHETVGRTLEQFREEMSALRTQAGAAEGPEAQAAQNRISELESAVSGFQKIIEEMRSDKTSAHETVGRTLEQFKEELAALRSRTGPAESPELQEAHNRISELESAMSGFRKMIEEMRSDKTGAHETVGRTLEQFKEELAALRSKAGPAESPELQAAQSRISELESASDGFRKTIEELRAEKASALEPVLRTLEQLREEMSELRSKAGAADELGRRLDSANLEGVTVGLGLLEGRMKNLEAGVVSQLNERFSALETSFGEVVRKANLAHETAAGSARALEKLEERAANLAYLENRLTVNEGKFADLYDLEAVVRGLKVSVESLENNFSEVMREAARVSSESKRLRADLEPLSHQVKHLTVLFNHFRTEFSFLISKKAESAGDL